MRILICTDGSPHGQAALRFGSLLARRSEEPATLLGVLEHAADRPKLEGALEEGQAYLAGAPAPEIKVRQGHAAEEILDACAEARGEANAGSYDLVVVGARGRRGITRFVMGSTAERIARHARAQVLIVRGEPVKLERILACTGGQPPGLQVVSFAGRVAQLVGAEVIVFHVMSQLAASPTTPSTGAFQVMPQTPGPPEPPRFQLEDLEATAEELMDHGAPEGLHLKEALAILRDMEVPAQALVRHGLVVDEISEEACTGPYDLVAVGAHAMGDWWMRLLLGDLSHQIIHCCPRRPILVVRPGSG